MRSPLSRVRLPRLASLREGLAIVAMPFMVAIAVTIGATLTDGALWAIGVAFVAAILAACGGYWLAWRFSNPARESAQVLASAAQRLAGGDFDTGVPLAGPSQTAQLRHAFNAMAETVRRLVSENESERNRLNLLLDSLADGVAVVDASSRVTLANTMARRLLRLPLDANHRPILRDHDLSRLAAECRGTGRRQTADVELLEGRRSVGVVAMPLSNEGTGAVLMTLHDLTQARNVDMTRREFVSNVSHELRNPIASVKAMVETLEGGLADADFSRDFLGRIHHEIDRMATLVDELLELSRIESGQVELQMEEVDVSALLADVRDSHLPAAAEQQVTITVEANGDVSPVQAEPAKLRRVFVNLVGNALKFTPPRGCINLTLSQEPGCIRIAVEDSGVGIEPEHLPHIFERFYKAHRSRDDRGTGLGLAIARHIVEAHGGRIDVRSTPGAGTTFDVVLPYGRA